MDELGVHDRTDEPDGHLDKTWSGTAFLLLQSDRGMDLLSEGDPIDAGSGLYAWSAERVAEAAALARLFSALESQYDPALMEECGIYRPGIGGAMTA